MAIPLKFSETFLNSADYGDILDKMRVEEMSSTPPKNPKSGEIYVCHNMNLYNDCDGYYWRQFAIIHEPRRHPCLTCQFFETTDESLFFRRAYSVYDGGKLEANIHLIHYIMMESTTESQNMQTMQTQDVNECYSESNNKNDDKDTCTTSSCISGEENETTARPSITYTLESQLEAVDKQIASCSKTSEPLVNTNVANLSILKKKKPANILGLSPENFTKLNKKPPTTIKENVPATISTETSSTSAEKVTGKSRRKSKPKKQPTPETKLAEENITPQNTTATPDTSYEQGQTSFEQLNIQSNSPLQDISKKVNNTNSTTAGREESNKGKGAIKKQPKKQKNANQQKALEKKIKKLLNSVKMGTIVIGHPWNFVDNLETIECLPEQVHEVAPQLMTDSCTEQYIEPVIVLENNECSNEASIQQCIVNEIDEDSVDTERETSFLVQIKEEPISSSGSTSKNIRVNVETCGLKYERISPLTPIKLENTSSSDENIELNEMEAINSTIQSAQEYNFPVRDANDNSRAPSPQEHTGINRESEIKLSNLNTTSSSSNNHKANVSKKTSTNSNRSLNKNTQKQKKNVLKHATLGNHQRSVDDVSFLNAGNSDPVRSFVSNRSQPVPRKYNQPRHYGESSILNRSLRSSTSETNNFISIVSSAPIHHQIIITESRNSSNQPGEDPNHVSYNNSSFPNNDNSSNANIAACNSQSVSSPQNSFDFGYYRQTPPPPYIPKEFKQENSAGSTISSCESSTNSASNSSGCFTNFDSATNFIPPPTCSTTSTSSCKPSKKPIVIPIIMRESFLVNLFVFYLYFQQFETFTNTNFNNSLQLLNLDIPLIRNLQTFLLSNKETRNVRAAIGFTYHLLKLTKTHIVNTPCFNLLGMVLSTVNDVYQINLNVFDMLYNLNSMISPFKALYDSSFMYDLMVSVRYGLEQLEHRISSQTQDHDTINNIRELQRQQEQMAEIENNCEYVRALNNILMYNGMELEITRQCGNQRPVQSQPNSNNSRESQNVSYADLLRSPTVQSSSQMQGGSQTNRIHPEMSQTSSGSSSFGGLENIESNNQDGLRPNCSQVNQDVSYLNHLRGLKSNQNSSQNIASQSNDWTTSTSIGNNSLGRPSSSQKQVGSQSSIIHPQMVESSIEHNLLCDQDNTYNQGRSNPLYSQVTENISSSNYLSGLENIQSPDQIRVGLQYNLNHPQVIQTSIGNNLLYEQENIQNSSQSNYINPLMTQAQTNIGTNLLRGLENMQSSNQGQILLEPNPVYSQMTHDVSYIDHLFGPGNNQSSGQMHVGSQSNQIHPQMTQTSIGTNSIRETENIQSSNQMQGGFQSNQIYSQVSQTSNGTNSIREPENIRSSNQMQGSLLSNSAQVIQNDQLNNTLRTLENIHRFNQINNQGSRSNFINSQVPKTSTDANSLRELGNIQSSRQPNLIEPQVNQTISGSTSLYRPPSIRQRNMFASSPSSSSVAESNARLSNDNMDSFRIRLPLSVPRNRSSSPTLLDNVIDLTFLDDDD